MFAGMANDIRSLKALARAESRKAEIIQSLLSAVLEVSGPVRIRGNMNEVPPALGFVVAIDGDQWLIQNKKPVPKSTED